MVGKNTDYWNIPRTMSTQHPDNVNIPEWVVGDIIERDAEVHEAYYAYSHLGCQEVMWDSEGKDVDTRVVRKLLEKYGEWFKDHVLGKDIFLTYRIPNPKLDIVERKIVVETLQNIAVSSDVASAFYKSEIIPISEVILPFTSEGMELVWLHNYYKNAIAATEEMELAQSLRVKDWVGSIIPKRIKVIPLIEDFDSLLNIDKIVKTYLDYIKPRYLRVFIARSDPALNYGLFCATILKKIAMSKLKLLEGEWETPIYPILGVGLMPFRGHLSPENLDGFLNEYKGFWTVTIQSAFRYDLAPENAKKFIGALNEKLPNGEPDSITPDDEMILLKILLRFKSRYQSIVEDLAPLINSIASYVPLRRGRKLHIGLFGYGRNIGDRTLPRAIPFAASLYSIGIPPEFIGVGAVKDLSNDEWMTFHMYYTNLLNDLNYVGGYLSWENIDMLLDHSKKVSKRAGMNEESLKSAFVRIQEDLKTAEDNLGIKLGPKSMTQKKYKNFVNNFLISYIEQNDDEARSSFIEAAKLRRCIG